MEYSKLKEIFSAYFAIFKEPNFLSYNLKRFYRLIGNNQSYQETTPWYRYQDKLKKDEIAKKRLALTNDWNYKKFVAAKRKGEALIEKGIELKLVEEILLLDL